MKNPWAADSWSVAAQGEVVRQYGVEPATRLARLAGSKIGATRPAPEDKGKLTVLVQRKNFTTVIGGGGSSGNGPPI